MSSISVDYDVLNQKGSPAWYSDTFANIPTPGYKGRMFISIDTFAFYRDNGVGWDLVGGPGTGTITGAGVSGQVTYFIGTDTISGNNNLFYDITNSRLGINTATPGAPLDIHSTGTAAQFNGTGVNNSFVLFQNAGTSKWRIGNLYNSGANDYQIFDVTNSTARLTIKNTGASTLIGTFTATSLIKSGGTNLQILLADGSTTPTSTFGTGSVTNVSALTLGTTGVDLSSSVANSTTTPVITLNVPTASATNRGALSSADWTTFNNKQATLSLTTTGTSGAATLVGATLNIPNYTNVGTVTSVAALTLGTTGTDLSSSVANSTSTPVITLNVPTASATNRGALSSADWTTFNNKQATISVTAPVVLTGATISMPAATTSVSGYLTSTDWNTFNNKTSNLGTVTDVVALTIGTTGIDITSTAVTTTTTPVITLNIPTASASNRGALSSTDWTTFNNKQATLSLTTTGTSGVATLVANTLNVPNYGSALSGYLPLTGGTLTGALNGTTASFIQASNDTDLALGYFKNSGTNGTSYKSKITIDGSYYSMDIGTTSNPTSYFGGTFGAFISVPASTPFFIAQSTTPILAFSTTGAATFSSSITATNLILNGSTTTAIDLTSGTFGYALDISNNDFIRQKNLAGTLGLILGMSTDDNLYVRGFSGINLQVNNGTTALTLALNQDATFSSGLYANGLATSINYKLGVTGAAFISGTNSKGVFITDNATYASIVGLNSAISTYNKLELRGSGLDGQLILHTSGNVSIGNTTDTGDQLYIAGNLKMTSNGKIDSNGGNLILQSATGVNLLIGSATSVSATSKLQVINSGSQNLQYTSSGSIECYAPEGNAGYVRFGAAYSLNGIYSGTSFNYIIEPTYSHLFRSQASVLLTIASTGVSTFVSRGNFLNATDNALFSLNSGGTLYTVGFSPTATASSTNTFTLTNGTTTWIYTGSGAATWTLPNPSGNNQIYWIKNAGTGAITLTAYSGTNIINNSAASVSTISIAVGATAVIAQDGNVKSYQLQ